MQFPSYPSMAMSQVDAVYPNSNPMYANTAQVYSPPQNPNPYGGSNSSLQIESLLRK